MKRKQIFDDSKIVSKLPGIEILHQFGVVLPPVHQVVDDTTCQVHDVVMELLAEAMLAMRVESVRRCQVLNHRLRHQFQEKPSGLQRVLPVSAVSPAPLEGQLFMHKFCFD